MTDRQIRDVFFRPRLGSGDLDEIKEPETEEDIRQWCYGICQWQGIEPEKAKALTERQVEKWRAKQNAASGSE